MATSLFRRSGQAVSSLLGAQPICAIERPTHTPINAVIVTFVASHAQAALSTFQIVFVVVADSFAVPAYESVGSATRGARRFTHVLVKELHQETLYALRRLYQLIDRVPLIGVQQRALHGVVCAEVGGEWVERPSGSSTQ